MNMIESAKAQVRQLTVAAYEKAAAAGLLPAGITAEPAVEIPKDTANGDYTTTFCLAAAKAMKMNPRQVAQTLIDHTTLTDSYFTSVEIAGPGFMNFRLGEKWFADTVSGIETAGEKYGENDTLAGRKYMVEFVSANPTGPMHMGNARGGVLGDTLASVLQKSGADVWREFYVNDAGNQIHKFAMSIDARYLQLVLGEENVPFPEDGYQGDYMNDIAKVYVEKYGDTLAQKPLEETLEFFSQETGKMVLGMIRKDLEDFGVKFDVWFSEKSLYDNGAVEPAMEALKERGYAYEEEGALWFRSTLFGDDKDRVLIRSNGMPTYFTSDVAYLKNKYDRGFERLVYVWGADHHGYVPRIKSVNKAFGFPDDGIEVLLIQMVNLLRDGKPVQMSKRAGTIVTLREIMDEVGRDAARLFFVIRRCDSTVDFDLELAKKASSENPVFYIQYAHARICSILRELESRGVAMPSLDELDVSLIADQSELNLVKAISRFPDEVAKAAAEYAPHRIAYYANELAEAFHAFYNSQRVLGVEENVMKSRILLVEAARVTLRNVLRLLGVSAPEKM